MTTAENNSVETQEKERRKQAIIAIFEGLRLKCALRIQEYELNQHFMLVLEGYKTELLKETDYLDLEYDHPLRAARALEKAINNPSLENYKAFENEAADSQFYPITRAVANGILIAFVFTALVCLIGSSVVFSAGVPLGLALSFMEFASALSMFSVSGPMGCIWGNVQYESYAPVTDSIRTGEEVAENLRFFKPVAAQPVDNVSTEYIASLPVAAVVG